MFKLKEQLHGIVIHSIRTAYLSAAHLQHATLFQRATIELSTIAHVKQWPARPEPHPLTPGKQYFA